MLGSLAILITSICLAAAGPAQAQAPPAQSSWLTGLDVVSNLVICIVGIGAIIAFFLAGIKCLRGLTTATKEISEILQKVLPPVLAEFVKKGFAPESAYIDCIKIVNSEKYSSKSPTKLNDYGKKLLEESGIEKVVNARLDEFIKAIEDQSPHSGVDVESMAFSVLVKAEDEKVTVHLQKYIFQNPDESLNTILFVGSFHLRDKYLEKHPEIVEMNPDI